MPRRIRPPPCQCIPASVGGPPSPLALGFFPRCTLPLAFRRGPKVLQVFVIDCQEFLAFPDQPSQKQMDTIANQTSMAGMFFFWQSPLLTIWATGSKETGANSSSVIRFIPFFNPVFIRFFGRGGGMGGFTNEKGNLLLWHHWFGGMRCRLSECSSNSGQVLFICFMSTNSTVACHDSPMAVHFHSCQSGAR